MLVTSAALSVRSLAFFMSLFRSFLVDYLLFVLLVVANAPSATPAVPAAAAAATPAPPPPPQNKIVIPEVKRLFLIFASECTLFFLFHLHLYFFSL